jgi:hypothetical protein
MAQRDLLSSQPSPWMSIAGNFTKAEIGARQPNARPRQKTLKIQPKPEIPPVREIVSLLRNAEKEEGPARIICLIYSRLIQTVHESRPLNVTATTHSAENHHIIRMRPVHAC